MSQGVRMPSNDDTSSVLETQIIPLNYGGGRILNLRVGIQNPEQAPIGDVLYFHGFGDRFDNHKPLFDTWAKAGLRVIAFDLPSHGERSGNYNDLNNFSFKALAYSAVRVENATQPRSYRPLILAGWSTGGLIIVRMLEEKWSSALSRPVSGVILFAPGVSVRKFPWTFGNGWGAVTNATLTHDPNPPHVVSSAFPDPTSPFWSHLVLKFAPRLLAESVLSQKGSYRAEIPSLVFTGGNIEDRYAKEWVIQEWIDQQNLFTKASPGNNIIDINCPNAMHELDNETSVYGGTEVRNSAAVFAQLAASGRANEFASAPSTFGNVCSYPVQTKGTKFGNPIKTFWTLSDSYKEWYVKSPREIADPMPWPKGFGPNVSPVYAHNEIVIQAPPEKIFDELTNAERWPNWYPNAGEVKIQNSNAQLAQGKNFTWITFGFEQKSQVTLFKRNQAIGWTASSFGVQAFHRWILYPLAAGTATRVVTEECDKGFDLNDTILGPDLLNPGLHASHQIWLENLEAQLTP